MQQPQLDLSKTTGVHCEECDGIFFDQTCLVRKVSRFVIGTPTDQYIPVMAFVCKQCNTPLKEFFPEGMTDVEEALGFTKVQTGSQLNIIQ